MNIQRIVQKCWFLCVVLIFGITTINAAESPNSLANSGNSGRKKFNSHNRVNSAGAVFGNTVEQRTIYQKQIEKLEQQVSSHNDQLVQLKTDYEQQIEKLQSQVSLKNVELVEIEEAYANQLTSINMTHEENEKMFTQLKSELSKLQIELIARAAAVNTLSQKLLTAEGANVLQSKQLKRLQENREWCTKNLVLEQHNHNITNSQLEEGQKSVTRLDNIIKNLNSVLTRYQIIITLLFSAVCMLALDKGGYIQLPVLSF